MPFEDAEEEEEVEDVLGFDVVEGGSEDPFEDAEEEEEVEDVLGFEGVDVVEGVAEYLSLLHILRCQRWRLCFSLLMSWR